MTLSLSVADDRLGQYFRRVAAIADRLDKSLPFDEVMDALQRIHDGKFKPPAANPGFLSHSLVAEALKMDLPDPGEVPLSAEEIAEASKRGEQLIWFPSKDALEKPITMKRLSESFGNKAPLGGKLLYSVDWCANEPFYAEETARSDSGLGSWRLVGTKAVPGTKGKNYLEQTVIAADYVTNKIYGRNPPDDLKPILAEPRERQDEIAKLMDSNLAVYDWKKAAEILANLKFNQMFRETPVEAMIRVIANQYVNKTRVLENEYSWTNVRSRNSRLVSFGGAVSNGARVGSWSPYSRDGDFGFVLSRSVTVESVS